MDLRDFIGLAKMYHREGWAVHEQLDDMMAGNFSDINPNAASAILPLLEELALEGVSDAQSLIYNINNFLEEDRLAYPSVEDSS